MTGVEARLTLAWLAAGSDASSVVTKGAAPARLVEAFTAGKRADRPSEDVVVVSGAHLAVIDGMSSPLRGRDETGSGRAYALRAAEVIAELPASIGAAEAVARISDAQRGLRPGHAGPAGAVAAIVSLARGEVWRIGDVHVDIGGTAHPGRKDVDTALAWFRAAVNAAHLADGASLDRVIAEDPGLTAAGELLRRQSALANRDVAFGYGVLDGTAVPACFVEVLRVPEDAEVVLASDGFLGAAPTLRTAEAELRAAIAVDPSGLDQLRGFAKAMAPGARAPDDRSYLRIAP